jgi:hypothetical protein
MDETDLSPLPDDEELEIGKEELDKQISGLLTKFGLAPEMGTEIDYNSLKKWALGTIVSLVAIGNHKVHNYCRPKSDKIHWARLTGYNLQILGSFLKEQDAEELKKRMELIENGFIKNRK